jgi:hypothetical protein
MQGAWINIHKWFDCKYLRAVDLGWWGLCEAGCRVLEGLFMLHKIVQAESKISSSLYIVPSSDNQGRKRSAEGALALVLIASRRCSAFFAEAAVLVLVFGILDYFMLKGRIKLGWIVGALGISVGLLGASIAMDFAAQRWAKGHP